MKRWISVPLLSWGRKNRLFKETCGWSHSLTCVWRNLCSFVFSKSAFCCYKYFLVFFFFGFFFVNMLSWGCVDCWNYMAQEDSTLWVHVCLRMIVWREVYTVNPCAFFFSCIWRFVPLIQYGKFLAFLLIKCVFLYWGSNDDLCWQAKYENLNISSHDWHKQLLEYICVEVDATIISCSFLCVLNSEKDKEFFFLYLNVEINIVEIIKEYECHVNAP